MSMAGYLFQPHRVLLHLVISPRGSTVGLETLDDIAAIYPDGSTLLEQTKLTRLRRPPLGDVSRNLWRTLYNWKTSVVRGDVDLVRTAFQLVTNAELRAGFVRELRDTPRASQARAALIPKLRALGSRTTGDVRPLAEDVLMWSDAELLDLLERVTVVDATSAGMPAETQAEIFRHLIVTQRYEQEIYEGLLGWIDSTALRTALDGVGIWFEREAFENRFTRLLFRYSDITRIRETAERLIAVTEKERQDRRGHLFVHQLQWTGLSADDEQILEAIDAHIRSGTETTRLCREGAVTEDDFRAFDDRLVNRWKLLKRRHHALEPSASEIDQQRAGMELLAETLLHREILADQPTSEYYLTQGAYHRLADDPPALGWHPLYKEKTRNLGSGKRIDEADG
jgi:hypothetical protein